MTLISLFIKKSNENFTISLQKIMFLASATDINANNIKILSNIVVKGEVPCNIYPLYLQFLNFGFIYICFFVLFLKLYVICDMTLNFTSYVRSYCYVLLFGRYN